MDKRYALDVDTVLDAFYDMRPMPDESAERFVDRVEERRVALGESARHLYRHFSKVLPRRDRRRLDGMAETAAWMGGPKLARPDWSALVRWS